MSGALHATPADREALAEVLRRPEFRDPAADAATIRRLLSDLWDRLLESLGTAEAERYASLGRAVFLAAVAAAALLAWRAVRRRRLAARATPATPADGPAGPAASGGAVPRPEAAAAALARGELAGAVRLAYAAAAAAVGGGAAACDALTGGELARRTPDPGFGALARLHDRTIFGRRPVAPAEAAEAVAVARRLAGRGGAP